MLTAFSATKSRSWQLPSMRGSVVEQEELESWGQKDWSGNGVPLEKSFLASVSLSKNSDGELLPPKTTVIIKWESINDPAWTLVSSKESTDDSPFPSKVPILICLMFLVHSMKHMPLFIRILKLLWKQAVYESSFTCFYFLSTMLF